MRVFFSIIFAATMSTALLGAVREKLPAKYSRNIENFKLSINLPIVDQVVELAVPKDQIAMRLRSNDRSITEPLQLMLPRDNKKFANSVKDLCIKNCQQFSQKLKQKIRQDNSSEKVVSISLTADLFNSLNKEKYLGLLHKKHHHLTLKTEDLEVEQKSELLRQMQFFLDTQEFAKLKSNLARNSGLNIDKYLLPKFATNVITHFTTRSDG